MCLGSCPWFPQATREANTLLKRGNEILPPNQGNRNKQRKTEVNGGGGRTVSLGCGRAGTSLLRGPDTPFLGGPPGSLWLQEGGPGNIRGLALPPVARVSPPERLVRATGELLQGRALKLDARGAAVALSRLYDSAQCLKDGTGERRSPIP